MMKPPGSSRRCHVFVGQYKKEYHLAMEELGVKKLPGGVRVSRSPGRLVVTIPSGGLLSLMHALVFGSIAWWAFPKLLSHYAVGSPDITGRALALFMAGFFISRFILDRQVVDIFQGRLVLTKYVSVFRYTSRSFAVNEISGLGLDIPAGKNHPGYIKLPKNPPIPKDSVSFRHEGRQISFAPGVERLAATYILNELYREGVPGSAADIS